MLKIEVSHFEEVLPIWKNDLWPDRNSPIEPTSLLDRNGNIDLTLSQSLPVFLVAKNTNEEIIGVTSGFTTGEGYFRKRGTFVQKDFRNNQVARTLFNRLEEIAWLLGCNRIWTMARNSSVAFYEQLGFDQTHETSQFEFGPHSFMQYQIDQSKFLETLSTPANLQE